MTFKVSLNSAIVPYRCTESAKEGSTKRSSLSAAVEAKVQKIKKVSFDSSCKTHDGKINTQLNYYNANHVEKDISDNYWNEPEMREVYLDQIIAEYTHNEIFREVDYSSISLRARLEQKLTHEEKIKWHKHALCYQENRNEKSAIKILNLYAKTISLEYPTFSWDEGFVSPEKTKTKTKRVSFNETVLYWPIELMSAKDVMTRLKTLKLSMSLAVRAAFEDPETAVYSVPRIISEYVNGNKKGLSRNFSFAPILRSTLSEDELKVWHRVVRKFQASQDIEADIPYFIELYKKTMRADSDFERVWDMYFKSKQLRPYPLTNLEKLEANNICTLYMYGSDFSHDRLNYLLLKIRDARA